MAMVIQPKGGGDAIWRGGGGEVPKADPVRVQRRAEVPAAVRAPGEAGLAAPILVQLRPEMLDRIEERRKALGFKSRSETIRVLLGEALG